jgi:Na+/melibiose symporter-like transporter
MVTFCYLLFSLILFFTASTAVTVPYNALLPELSLDPHERTTLSAWRQPFSIFGLTTGIVLLLPLVAYFGGGRDGFLKTALVFGLVAIIVFFITFSGVRERPDFMKKESLPMAESFSETVKNRPFWIFIAVCFLVSVGYAVFSAVLIYYVNYWLGSEKQLINIMGIVMGFSLLSIPVWVYISGRIGKKDAFLVGIAVLMIGAVLLLIHPRDVSYFLYAIMGIVGIGAGAYYLFPYAIMPEIVDFDEIVTKTRREGVFFGIYLFIFKIAIGTASLVTSFVLDGFGYIPNVEQTETALFGIRMLVGGIPLVFFILGFLALLKFPLTKKRYEEISQTLSGIRGANI